MLRLVHFSFCPYICILNLFCYCLYWIYISLLLFVSSTFEYLRFFVSHINVFWWEIKRSFFLVLLLKFVLPLLTFQVFVVSFSSTFGSFSQQVRFCYSTSLSGCFFCLMCLVYLFYYICFISSVNIINYLLPRFDFYFFNLYWSRCVFYFNLWFCVLMFCSASFNILFVL